MKRRLFAVVIACLALPALGQDHSQMDHSAHMMQQGTMQQMGDLSASGPAISEAGQSAFAAIQEIVAALESNPETDWETVNIAALRSHLVDMNNVTLRADVSTEYIDGGARFLITSDDAEVVASIRNMVTAHASMVTADAGWKTEARHVDNGAALTVVGEGNQSKIRGLGFFGILALGMHHQLHHMALATGSDPHSH